MVLVKILVVWLVTAVSFWIVSKLPTGVEIDDFKKALIASGVFGLLNAILGKVLWIVAAPLMLLSFGLLYFPILLVINAGLFGLAAWLVEGFRLKWGWGSAFLGSLALSFVNMVLFKVIPLN